MSIRELTSGLVLPVAMEDGVSQIDEIKQTIIDGFDDEARDLTQRAVDAGMDARHILDSGLIAGMGVVGERFRLREVFLPDVLLAARAMYAGLDIIQPLLEGEGGASRGTVVVGTVEGDLHDIGKNLVAIMLRGAGYKVVDLGQNVSPAAFVEAVQTHSAQIVGMSTLLTTTMPAMGRVVSALKEAGLDQVHTLVGGAPLSDSFAREIGATAYGFDAMRAVEIVQGLAT